MSTCSTMMIEACKGTSSGETPVSLGYDGVRFLKPVFIGDTITLTYTIESVDAAKRQSQANIQAQNQRGELVGVAKHILRWVKDQG
jgi:3-hydroxybutyryl-CoA dehydratase